MSAQFRNLILLLICLSSFQMHSQDGFVDSLERILKRTQIDTQRVNVLQELCKHFLFEDSKKALGYGQRALSLSNEIDYQKGSAKALHNMGIVYYNTSNYDSALYYFTNSLIIKKKLGDKKGMASSLNNIGAITALRGDLDKATNHYLQSLKINEELNNDEGALSAAINIGNIISDQHNYQGALKYYRIGLNFAKKAKNDKGIADAYHNIAVAQYDLEQKDSALIYSQKALHLYEEAGINERLSASYLFLGQWYSDNKQLDTALVYFEKAKQSSEASGNQESVANALQHIGKIFLLKRDFVKAEKNFIEGLSLAKDLGIKEYESVYYDNLAELYFKEGDFPKAYQYHVLYAAIKDSLITKESLKQVADMSIKYESEKKEQQISLLNKDKELQVANLKKQRLVIFAIIGGLLMAITLALFVWRSLKITRKQNAIIDQQKKLVEEKNLMIEQKNRDMIDSINYAKRIQDAILKEEEHVSEHLPEHFILFKPKDIVSGDFYWAKQHENKFYLALCDSTGHGVPGAFMSLLNIGFMSEAIKEKNISAPNEVFNYVRKRLIESISKEEQKDGMDGTLICFEENGKVVTYASAHNSPLMISNGEATILPYDKMPVGKGERMDDFQLFSFTPEQGDQLYLFTDGYADQFGGPKGKKFKNKTLKELLISNSAAEPKQQSIILNQEFEAWRGNLEQVDDVCVIGIKF